MRNGLIRIACRNGLTRQELEFRPTPVKIPVRTYEERLAELRIQRAGIIAGLRAAAAESEAYLVKVLV